MYTYSLHDGARILLDYIIEPSYNRYRRVCVAIRIRVVLMPLCPVAIHYRCERPRDTII